MTTAMADKPAKTKKVEQEYVPVPFGELKAVVSAKAFAAGVLAVKRVVKQHSKFQILKHILVTAKNDKLILMATDLETWIEHTINNVPTIAEGSCAVPVNFLSVLVVNLPQGNITLSGVTDPKTDNSGHLVMTTGRAEYSIRSISDTFPKRTEVAYDHNLVVEQKLWRTVSRQALSAVSEDETRPIITGVYVESFNDGLRMVCTDTHRLVVRTFETVRTTHGVQHIIPNRVIRESLRLSGPLVGVDLASDSVRVSVVTLSGAVTRITSKLIEGQYPNWHCVLPVANHQVYRLTLDRAKTLQSVRRLAPLLIGGENRLIFAPGETLQELVLCGEHYTSKVSEVIEVQHVGNSNVFEKAFNAKYIADALSVMESEFVHMDYYVNPSKMNAPDEWYKLRPVVFTECTGDHFKLILMPMQVV